MNKGEYERYRMYTVTSSMIHISQIRSVPRTLALGYTVDRESWHAYVMDDAIHRLIYTISGGILDHAEGTSFKCVELRPSKRVYPDTVDIGFANLMRDADYELPFLGNFNWDSGSVLNHQYRVARTGYYALTHKDLT